MLVLFGVMLVHNPAQAQTKIIDKVKAEGDQNQGYVQPEVKIRRDNAIPLNTVQEAFATAPATATTKFFPYSPKEHISILTRLTMGTTIVFPEGEEIPDNGAFFFDPTAFKWSVRTDGQGNMRLIVLLPRYAKADTNLIVTGRSGNIYKFYVMSEDYHAEQVPDFVVYINDATVKERVLALNETDDIIHDAELLAEQEKASLDALRLEGEFLPSRQLDHDYLSALPYENPANINTAYVLK